MGQFRWQPLYLPPRYYNLHRSNLEQPSWFQVTRYGPDFRNLPDGEQSLGGVTWFIMPDRNNSGPDVITIAGIGTSVTSENITGIPVQQKVEALAFLHTLHLANRKQLSNFNPGTVVFHYRIHYSNGSVIDIPIRYNHEIGDWYTRKRIPLPHAEIAWSQPVKRRRDYSFLALYSYTWRNPHPDLLITKIDMIRDCPPLQATPALFAISLGTSAP